MTTKSIPRRVVMAGLAQGLLLLGDVITATVAAFGFLGMSTSERTSDDLPGAILLAWFALVGVGGLALGLAALRGFWVGASWARSLAIAHGGATVFTCCPCVWPVSVWAILTAMHEEVVRWPEDAARGDASIADVFR